MCYNISKYGNDNLYNLLSNNDKNNKEYIKDNGNDVEYVLRQAYKTVGDNFRVIDNDTISIIYQQSNLKLFLKNNILSIDTRAKESIPEKGTK